MPRRSRTKSTLNMYHCMIRGINKQDIFFDDSDYFKFKSVLKKSKEIFSYRLYSYVIMPNHIHLEIEVINDDLCRIMQSIQICYSSYFNKKYERVGHVFQNRYQSKPIETQDYLLNLLRYIHKNPEKAKICKSDKYKWSSYSEYIIKKEGIIDVEEILLKFSDNYNESIEKFINFHEEMENINNIEQMIEYEMLSKLTDNQVIGFLKEDLKIENLQEVQSYSKLKRNEIIRHLKGIKGCTNKQISRILGINIRIIQRV